MTITAALGLGFMLIVGVATTIAVLGRAVKAIEENTGNTFEVNCGDPGVIVVVWRSKKTEAIHLWKALLPMLVDCYTDQLLVHGLITARHDVRDFIDGLEVTVRDDGEVDVDGTKVGARWTGHIHLRTMWVSLLFERFPAAALLHEWEHGRDQTHKGLTWILHQSLETHFVNVDESRDIVAAALKQFQEMSIDAGA